jgi:hypothetical protein
MRYRKIKIFEQAGYGRSGIFPMQVPSTISKFGSQRVKLLNSAERKVKKGKSEGKDLCVFRNDVYNPVGSSCSHSGAKSFPRGVAPTCRSQTPPSVTIRSAPCRCRSRKCFSFHNESSRVLGYLASHRRPLSRSTRSSTESPTRAPAFLIPTSGEVGYIPARNTFLRGQALDCGKGGASN